MRLKLGIFAAAIVMLFGQATLAAPDRIVVGNSAPFLDGERWLFEQVQVHYVAVVFGGDNGTVNLHFGHFNHPAIIVLSSQTPVEWRLAGTVPAEVKAILLNRGDSLVSALPADLPVYRWRTDHYEGRYEFLPCPAPTKLAYQHYCRELDPIASVRDFRIQDVERDLLFTEYRFVASYAISFAPPDIQTPGIQGGGRNKLWRVRQPTSYERPDEPLTPMPDFSSRAIVDLDELRFQDFVVKLVYKYRPEKARPDCQTNCNPATDVVVQRSKDPIVLVISSYDEMKWHLLIEPKIRLLAIVLRNADPSVLNDIDPQIPIWWDHGDRSVARDWSGIDDMARLFPGRRATLFTPPNDGGPVIVR